MKNRSRSDILTMMLESTRAGSTKTKIMYTAYLSYSQLMEYLPFLQKNDLITYEKGTQIYRVTEKGLKFLSMSHDLDDMMISATDSKYLLSSY
ncbi:MAG TPA: winged helix-turn-helix domain-containing protein [Candidatus Nitrosotalea sp.]|nr:winged helix-turn-helix domain-containing protein [Candidatus Nitrosotalea sp.]